MIGRSARILAAPVLVAACGNPAPAVPSAVDGARITMDGASSAYAACVDRASRTIDVATDQAAALAALAVKSCAAARGALATQIVAFQRIASPKQASAVADTVAERSVRVADGDLRDRAAAIIVGRQLNTMKPG